MFSSNNPLESQGLGVIPEEDLASIILGFEIAVWVLAGVGFVFLVLSLIVVLKCFKLLDIFSEMSLQVRATQLWNVFKDFICCRHCCCSSRRGTPSPTNESITDVELRLKIKDVFDIDLLPKKKWQGTENDNGSIRACSICQEDFVKNQELRTLPCEHDFHKDCIDKWLMICKADICCPNCKGSVTKSFSPQLSIIEFVMEKPVERVPAIAIVSREEIPRKMYKVFAQNLLELNKMNP